MTRATMLLGPVLVVTMHGAAGALGAPIEAGIDYAVAIRGRQPLQLSLHMTDPDRLTSSTFILDDLSGPVRAADQARAMMASARYHW